MKKRRRWLRWLLALLGITAGFVVASPWWLPRAVTIAGPWFDLRIESWEKETWDTVTYRGVAWERDNVRVDVGALRMPVFGVWPRGAEEGTLRPVEAWDVVVTIAPAPPPDEEVEPGVASTHRILVGLVDAWPAFQRWLPPARVERIEIRPGDATHALHQVDWDGETLRVSGPVPEYGEEANLALSVVGDALIRLDADIPAEEGTVRIEARVHGSGTDVAGTVQWHDNMAEVTARFELEGWVPESASFIGENLAIDGAHYGWEPIRNLTGDVRIEWASGTYVAMVDAAAQPGMGDEPLPPVRIELRLSGDPTRFEVETASVNVPGLKGALMQPLEFSITDGTPEGSAEFQVEVDLVSLPWIEAGGRLAGIVRLDGDGVGEPEIAFDLAGEEIEWRDAALRSLRVSGKWQPSLLRVDTLSAILDDDSWIEASGSVDLLEQRIEIADVQARTSAGALRPWLPALPEFDEFAVILKVSGPLENPVHSGSVSWTGLAGGPGGALAGDAKWEGEGQERLAVDARLDSASGIMMPLSIELRSDEAGAWAARLHSLEWHDSEGEWWRLQEPAEIVVRGTSVEDMGVSVSRLRLQGPQAALSLNASIRWPLEGEVVLHSERIDLSRLAPLLPDLPPQVTVARLELDARWQDGPVHLNGGADVTFSPSEENEYHARAQFESRSDAVVFESLSIRDESGTVLEGEGRFPLAIRPGQSGLDISAPRDGPIELNLASTENPAFWDSISEIIGWTISSPELEARVTGSLDRPRGRIAFRSSRLIPPAPRDNGGLPFPALDNVTVVLDADETGLRLSDLRFSVEENWITATGTAPWAVWEQFRNEGSFHWQQCEFRVASAPIPLAIPARVVPHILAPEGHSSFRIAHRPGDGFSGFLWLHNAALRPIQPLGPVRDIDGRARLDGYSIVIPSLVGHLGGRPVEISGSADLSQPEDPAFELTLQSSRVPLVRQQGLVLRASLDLQVVRERARPAHISGSVNVGSSFYVTELATLLDFGGGVTSPADRPPYFSVTAQPFADWTLAVDLLGEGSMRVDTPFFRGTLSSDLTLLGTLEEPRLLGRVTSPSGRVVFPFGTVPLDVLEVSLTEENPYDPELLARGSTRIYGHDIRLEVTGTASDPRLLFSSDPPLASQDIFLMLSTGEIPDRNHEFTTAERAQRLAMFIGQNIARQFGILGDEGRLTVHSGEEFTRDGVETIRIEYRLDRRWSVVGERDRFDDYNAGIRFHVINR